MEVKIIHEDIQKKVVAVYLYGKFFYTKTYIFDSERFVDKSITVFADGTVNVQ